MNLYRVVDFYEPFQTWVVEVTHGEEGYKNHLHVPKSVAKTGEDAIYWLEIERPKL